MICRGQISMSAWRDFLPFKELKKVRTATCWSESWLAHGRLARLMLVAKTRHFRSRQGSKQRVLALESAATIQRHGTMDRQHQRDQSKIWGRWGEVSMFSGAIGPHRRVNQVEGFHLTGPEILSGGGISVRRRQKTDPLARVQCVASCHKAAYIVCKTRGVPAWAQLKALPRKQLKTNSETETGRKRRGPWPQPELRLSTPLRCWRTSKSLWRRRV